MSTRVSDVKVSGLLEEVTNRLRDLDGVVRRRVLEKLIAALQERLDQLPKVDNTLPEPEEPEVEPEPPTEPEPEPKA